MSMSRISVAVLCNFQSSTASEQIYCHSAFFLLFFFLLLLLAIFIFKGTGFLLGLTIYMALTKDFSCMHSVINITNKFNENSHSCQAQERAILKPYFAIGISDDLQNRRPNNYLSTMNCFMIRQFKSYSKARDTYNCEKTSQTRRGIGIVIM